MGRSLPRMHELIIISSWCSPSIMQESSFSWYENSECSSIPATEFLPGMDRSLVDQTLPSSLKLFPSPSPDIPSQPLSPDTGPGLADDLAQPILHSQEEVGGGPCARGSFYSHLFFHAQQQIMQVPSPQKFSPSHR